MKGSLIFIWEDIGTGMASVLFDSVTEPCFSCYRKIAFPATDYFIKILLFKTGQ